MSYVCAFRGRRDGYEVPLALAESGRLDRFITDVFRAGPLARVAAALPASVRKKLDQRSKLGLPPDRVQCLLAGTALESLMIRLGAPAAVTYMRFDAMYSRAAANTARTDRCDLFLYSPYAMPAFALDYPHRPLKVLFQFHPHVLVEAAILQQDRDRWAPQGVTFSERLARERAPESRPDYDNGWKYSDLILCASSFTMRSLRQAGARDEVMSVIPYGIDLPPVTHPNRGPRSQFHALFVGSGIQRKGLHHLLQAWKHAGLGKSGQLTIVSRVIEPSLQRMAAETSGVTLLPGVSQEELKALYANATLFCMPSLVEGFGQVYLEALSHGLPVLGTVNTGLPDLGGVEDAIYTVEPGDVLALEERLCQLARSLPGVTEHRIAARKCASRFTWESFRRKITSALATLEARRDNARS